MLLDGSGATAADLAVRLNDSLKEATAPLEAVQAAELAELEELAKSMGERGLPGRKDILDRHKREVRRYQTTELRAGLGVLSRSYRDWLVGALDSSGPTADVTVTRATRAIDEISTLSGALSRNPRMPLALESLLVSLSLS